MIGDRYEPIELIATGGMATVWRARDTLLGRLVAVKRLLPHLARDPVAAERFQREAQAAAGLNHPGIVTVFDSAEDEQGPFIVMELIEGPTLSDHLAGTGPLDPGAVVDIVAQLASALDHAHAEGVIHRDIKPGNVILGDGGRVRLADFGIARTLEDPTTITGSGELVGTIAYLAPEILAGEPARVASDIYSLGAVSYELLAGAPPYTGATPAALLEAVRSGDPPSLRGVAPDHMVVAVSAAMARDPSARPGSAGDLVAALAGSATLVMGTDLLARPPAMLAGSDDPTLVTDRSPEPTRPPPMAPGARARWVVGSLAGALALTAAALSLDDNRRGSEQANLPIAAATTSSTIAVTTTTAPITTTTSATTTTTSATTTTLRTPEVVAGEIEGLLATLEPPDYHPKEVRQVEDRLHESMDKWAGDHPDDTAKELERAFEEVADLGRSEKVDELWDRFVELAELMGFQVEQVEDDDD